MWTWLVSAAPAWTAVMRLSMFLAKRSHVNQRFGLLDEDVISDSMNTARKLYEFCNPPCFSHLEELIAGDATA